MEQGNLHNNSANNTNSFRPEFLNDSSEFDDINFKAITDGLGFHHGSSEKVNTRSYKQKAPKKMPPKINSRVNTEKVSKPVSPAPSSNNNYMGGLEAFYKNEVKAEAKVEPRVTKKIQVKKTQAKQATIVEQMLAFITDLFLITGFMGLMFGIAIVASGVDFNLITKLLTFDELITYSLVIFSLNYLLYFTILEIKATPGKQLLGLRIVKTKNKPINAITAFVRACLSLVQLPVFILMAFKWHDSILGTKVIHTDEN